MNKESDWMVLNLYPHNEVGGRGGGQGTGGTVEGGRGPNDDIMGERVSANDDIISHSDTGNLCSDHTH